MYPRSVRALRADALFVSALPRSGELNASQIRRAVMVALRPYAGAGCAPTGRPGVRRPPGHRSRPDAVGLVAWWRFWRVTRSRGHGRWRWSTALPPRGLPPSLWVTSA